MIMMNNPIQYGVNFLIVTLVIILCVILYKKLLKKWGKDQPNADEFIILYSLESPISKGEVEFLFEQKEKKHVHFCIENKVNEQLALLLDDESKKGMHILRYDTTQLPDGNYYYVLKTNNQSTSKLMRIRNSNQ